MGTPTIFADSSQGNPTAWHWNFGDATAGSTQTNPTHLYADTGSYFVQLTVSTGICSDSLSHLFTVTQIPTSIFLATDTICFGETALITYTGNAPSNANYSWNFASAAIQSGSGKGPYIVSWADSGIYSVSLSVIQNICASDTSHYTIKVKSCKKPELVFPNVFTPNGDGKNDVFKIGGLETYPLSELLIFNRWGNLVYKNSDYQNDWNGQGHPDGVYYYILTLNDKSVFKGSVTIIR